MSLWIKKQVFLGIIDASGEAPVILVGGSDDELVGKIFEYVKNSRDTVQPKYLTSDELVEFKNLTETEETDVQKQRRAIDLYFDAEGSDGAEESWISMETQEIEFKL